MVRVGEQPAWLDARFRDHETLHMDEPRRRHPREAFFKGNGAVLWIELQSPIPRDLPLAEQPNFTFAKALVEHGDDMAQLATEGNGSGQAPALRMAPFLRTVSLASRLGRRRTAEFGGRSRRESRPCPESCQPPSAGLDAYVSEDGMLEIVRQWRS